MVLLKNKFNPLARTNGILFFIVIILSLIAWFQPGLHQTVIHYLSPLKSKAITTIILERQDIGAIKLKKEKNGWFMHEPYRLPANTLRVDTITKLAQKRSYSQFQIENDELSRYHLDKPFVSVWLNETELTLGSEDPINRQRYAMNINDNIHSGNNTVHLINGVIFYQLRANLDTFISPALIPPQASLKSIVWPDNELHFTHNRWELTSSATHISPDSVAQLIQSWQQSKAKKVETKVSFSINNAELLKSPSVTIRFVPFGETDSAMQTIQYLIIQDGKQIKLFRTDIQIAYWINPQMLKQLTELSLQKTSKETPSRMPAQ